MMEMTFAHSSNTLYVVARCLSASHHERVVSGGRPALLDVLGADHRRASTHTVKSAAGEVRAFTSRRESVGRLCEAA